MFKEKIDQVNQISRLSPSLFVESSFRANFGIETGSLSSNVKQIVNFSNFSKIKDLVFKNSSFKNLELSIKDFHSLKYLKKNLNNHSFQVEDNFSLNLSLFIKVASLKMQ